MPLGENDGWWYSTSPRPQQRFPKNIILLRVIPTLTLICLSFWHIIWKNILDYIRYNFLTFYSGILSGITSIWHPLCFYTDIFSGILSGIFSAICSGIRSGILSGIYSEVLFWHFLSGISSGILCGWGPAGNIGEHSDPVPAVEVRRKHYDPVLAVRVRQGPLRSRACSWGPAEEGGGRWGGGGGPADIKSNNPHLTGEIRTYWRLMTFWRAHRPTTNNH